VSGHRGADGLGLRPWLGRSQSAPSVRSVMIVVADVGVEHALEMSPTQDEQPVETLSPDCPDPPLRVGVRARCPHRRPKNPDVFTPEDVVKRSREFAVAVAHEEPDGSGRLRHRDG
jgi:hypothetical protein